MLVLASGNSASKQRLAVRTALVFGLAQKGGAAQCRVNGLSHGSGQGFLLLSRVGADREERWSAALRGHREKVMKGRWVTVME